MNKAIRNMIPKRMVPMAQRIYWTLRANGSGAGWSREQYADLAALKCLVSYNRYGGYCVPESSRHRPAARAILSNHVWEPGTIRFMAANCGAGDVVHAGTFFGDFLPALSKAVAPGARVWAFEPNRENYRCTRITMEINDLANVVLANAGLGATQELLFLRTRDEDGRSLGGASRISGQDSDGRAGESVQVVTIDDIIGPDRNVSIIQLDVEGHEKEALTGALKTIQRCLPTLVLEALPGDPLLGSGWFAENILSLGYRKTGDVHQNSVFSSVARH